MQLGTILLAARQAANLTQTDLADALGISRPYLHDLERGRRDFPAKRVPDLPPAIREPVVQAMITYHFEQIERLRSWLPKVG